MRKLLICMLMLASPAYSMKGNALQQNMLEAEALNVHSNGGNFYQAGLFHGYVTGVAEGTSGLLWCPREGVTNGQEVAVVSKFLSDHPERLDDIASVLVGDALRAAFPCPKK